MMTILQNAFSNAASSIGQAKFQGNIVDILMAPLNNFELTLGYVLGSITRGVICGFATYIGILFFIPLNIFDPFASYLDFSIELIILFFISLLLIYFLSTVINVGRFGLNINQTVDKI